MKNIVSAFMVALILVSTLIMAIDVRPVRAIGTIYIRADGSIDPPTANITTTDNVTYTFTDNNYDSIVVERDNIIVDGAGYTLQGSGSGTGFHWSGINNVTIKRTDIRNFDDGIWLDSSSSNTISGNNITANNLDGIALGGSSGNSINGNNIASDRNGIYLSTSSNNTIDGNNIQNSDIGINLYYSPSNIISANTVADDRYGISLQSSLGNIISGNNITKSNEDGIYLIFSSSNNSISGNNITANTMCGIFLSSSSSNIIYGNTIANNLDGVELYSSSNSTIQGNNITDNGYLGIYLQYSSDSSISGNNITSNGYGIRFSSSSDNTVYHNNFMDNTQQVSSTSSSNTWDDGYPSGGNCWSNYTGLDVKSGPGQNLPGSDGVGDVQLVLDASNTDNYPLMQPYLGPVRNLHTGESYPTIQAAIYDAADGDTILALSGIYREHLIVNKSISLYGQGENTVVDGGGEGLPIIHVFNTANVTISDLVVQNTTAIFESYGISLYRVSDSTIQNVVVRRSFIGVRIDNSTDCRLLDSIIVNNINSGIVLRFQSTHNQIVGNSVVMNPTGILVDWSMNNMFYHNNLVNNTRQTVVFGGPNAWDNGYPSGGNYWSNYTDVDLCKGPGQNETGDDGVWDQPYVMDGSNQDMYPLTKPFGGPAGDVDGDRDVDIFDIVRMAGVYGVKYPDARYDRLCDMDLDGDIDIFDIVKAAVNYGKTW